MTSTPRPDRLLAPALIEGVFRDEHARAVAALVRAFGDVQAAEDAVQDAFAVALERWPADGLPVNPGGWITTTARRRAIDVARRQRRGAELLRQDERSIDPPDPLDDQALPDERLALICLCCHPALAADAQVALTLRLVAGLDPATIARMFLVREDAMAQRLARARRKIRDARIPLRTPPPVELERRLGGVLATISLIATAGWRDPEQTGEATRLARLVVALTDHPEAVGLLALLRLQDSRASARTDEHGVAVPLPDQDRSRWDVAAIGEGLALLASCEERGQPGPYQVQAAIQAAHATAVDAAATDWPHIVALYDLLSELNPSPIVALNRAVAVAELHGPAVALELVEPLALHDHAPYHAVRAHLLSQLGRAGHAAAAYARAAELAPDDPERRFLAGRCLATES